MRGDKLDLVSNIIRDIYHLHIYQSEITQTATITEKEYEEFEQNAQKLQPELLDALIEKPSEEKEKSFYVEDIRNCIISNFNFESFKNQGSSYAILNGDIVFQIEYRVKEKITVHVPEDGIKNIRVKRAAVENTPKKSGQKLEQNTWWEVLAGFFSIGAGLMLLMALIAALKEYWKPVLIFVGIAVLLWLMDYFGKHLLKIVSTLITWVIGLLVFGFWLTWIAGGERLSEDRNVEEEVMDTLIEPNIEIDPTDSLAWDSVETPVIYNALVWSDYSNIRHSFNYSLQTSEVIKSGQNRAQFIGYRWDDIYNSLYNNDQQLLSEIYLEFDSLKKGLDALDFARLVVSAIQETPYTWILPEPCDKASNQLEISRSGFSCLGGIVHYGVQSPLEFLANQKGDCDTKSLMIYTILKHFNYDVRILTSVYYKHAVLGILIPANGKFVIYQGKKYYAWETTVKGFDVGQLPPGNGNMALWEVAL